MREKPFGETVKQRAGALLIIFLLSVCLIVFFCTEHPAQEQGTQKTKKQTAAVQDAPQNAVQDTGGENFGRVEVNHSTYRLRHEVTSWLVIGTDVSGNQEGVGREYQGAMADFLLLVVFDETENSYGMLQLNRDTMTKIHLLDHDGKGEATARIQLCNAHWYGGNRQQGCENTVRAVSGLLGGISIDGYYELPMSAIPILNAQVGGVEVTISNDFTEIDASMKEGETITLNDSQAYHYIHDRYGVGDEENTSRMARQRQYMGAFAEKAGGLLEEDGKFAARVLHALEPYTVSEIDYKRLLHFAETLDAYHSKGTFVMEGELTTGEALGDGLEHREFYPDEASIEETLVSMYPLEKEKDKE